MRTKVICLRDDISRCLRAFDGSDIQAEANRVLAALLGLADPEPAEPKRMLHVYLTPACYQLLGKRAAETGTYLAHAAVSILAHYYGLPLPAPTRNRRPVRDQSAGGTERRYVNIRLGLELDRRLQADAAARNLKMDRRAMEILCAALDTPPVPPRGSA